MSRESKHRTFYCAEKGGELLVGPDGLSWEHRAVIPTSGAQPTDEPRPDHRTTPSCNEADIHFRPDGELWCVSRSKRDPDDSLFYWSRPPYEKWDCMDLGTRIHSPVFYECSGTVYVAGRVNPAGIWFPQHDPAGNTGIFRIDKSGVTPLLALPSDGDAAYPGLISPEPGRLIITYYSQHAYLSGTVGFSSYTQDFAKEWLDEERYPLSLELTGPSDIFVAEIDVEAENVRRRL